MIIFDLDGTLADCEHRRHFIDRESNPNIFFISIDGAPYKWLDITTNKPFKADYQAFFEACDKDKPIYQTLSILSKFIIGDSGHKVEIWSGRCESQREKTIDWFFENWFVCCFDFEKIAFNECLKMRPIGDFTPDEELKEKWLDEAIFKGEKIEMVFDDRPKVIRMWRRRGIFVFNCNQLDREF